MSAPDVTSPQFPAPTQTRCAVAKVFFEVTRITRQGDASLPQSHAVTVTNTPSLQSIFQSATTGQDQGAIAFLYQVHLHSTQPEHDADFIGNGLIIQFLLTSEFDEDIAPWVEDGAYLGHTLIHAVAATSSQLSSSIEMISRGIFGHPIAVTPDLMMRHANHFAEQLAAKTPTTTAS